MKRYCKIVACENYLGTDNVEIHMFRIPKDSVRRQEWINALNGVQCTNSNLICIKHFTEECYIIKSNRYVLNDSAVPTIFSVAEKTTNLTQDETVSTAIENVSSVEQQDACTQHLENEVKFLREYVGKLEQELQSKSKVLQLIIDTQTKEIELLKNRLEAANSSAVVSIENEEEEDVDEKNRKRREILSCLANGISHREAYSPAVRDFAITLRNISSAAYRFVRHEFNNNLPHSVTITDWHANSDINCEQGIMDHSFRILKLRIAEVAKKGQKLHGALLFDEMSIRQHLQFVGDKMLGFENYPGMDVRTADVATEVLVYMFSGINDDIRLPLAYFFVTKKLDAEIKMDLTKRIIDRLLENGAEVEAIVFDGLRTNPAMCEKMGAKLDVYANNFDASFMYNEKHIRVLYDFSHVIKLVRNNLAIKQVFFDAEGNQIKWYYFEKLVHFKDKRNFALSHKITRAHIDYSSNPMKVRLAVETLSASAARAMEFLMNQGHPEFANAAATIKFTRIINDLFDVFNSTDDKKNNPLKNPMSSKNIHQILPLFNEGAEYIKGLEIIDNGKRVKLCSLLS